MLGKTKRNRSRLGCTTCRRAKIKCDELKPSCSQCIKHNKKCEYVLNLIWGGRPYKKPKIEKMNPVANMSLSGEPMHVEKKSTANENPTRRVVPETEKVEGKIKVKVNDEKEVIIKPTFDPAENLNMLLQMTERVNNGMHKVNDKLESMFNEKLIHNSPWSLLENLESQIPGDIFNGQINTTENSLNNDQNGEIPFLDDELVELPNEYSLDNFNIDMYKLQDLNTIESSLIPVSLLDESPNKMRNFQDSSPEFSEHIDTIPRGLLPLPDMLLNVPYYYDCFQFYTNSTACMLTPADPQLYINNPFKMVLPKLAMTNEGLMSLVVAFGAKHKSSLINEDCSEIVDSLLSRALSDLLILLKNRETSTSDLTLTIVILFSSFLAFNYRSNKWKVHMNGAKQIFLLRGYNKPFNKLLNEFGNEDSLLSGEIKKTKLLYFLIRWYAYIDIFTNLSSPLEPTAEEIGQSVELTLSPCSESSLSSSSMTTTSSASKQEVPQIDYEIRDAPTSDESYKNIDFLLGFDIRLLPLFKQLTALIKQVNVQLKQNIPLSSSTIESALNLQNKFNKLKNVKYGDSNSLNEVIASNSCFLTSGLIQLYRRVLRIPRNSKIIQEMSSDILQTINTYINTKQPNSLGVISPLFFAGCESLTENRGIFIEKLQDFMSKGSVSAGVAIDIMEKCWNTGEDWDKIMLQEGKNVVFL